VETDPVLMSEFNENFNTLDSAVSETVAGQMKYVTGSYVGDDTFTKTLYFPFRPIFVYLHNPAYQNIYYTYMLNGMEKSGVWYQSSYNYTEPLELHWDENSLTYTRTTHLDVNEAHEYALNGMGINYSYYAFGI